jgi:hypothetical protein
MARVPSPLALLAAAVIALPSAAAACDPLAPGPAGANCIGGLAAGYCADATAATGVACTVSGSTYSCDLSAAWGLAGSSGAGLPGDVSGPGHLEVVVCDDNGCTQSLQDVGAPCSWSLGQHGCSTSGSSSWTVSGPHATCLEVYVTLQVDAHLAPAGVPLTLVQDEGYAPSAYSDC